MSFFTSFLKQDGKCKQLHQRYTTHCVQHCNPPTVFFNEMNNPSNWKIDNLSFMEYV